MSIYYTGPSYLSLTPEELAAQQQKLALKPSIAPGEDDLNDLANHPLGPSIISASGTLTGAADWWIANTLSNNFSSNAEYSDPLNFKLKNEYDPMNDPLSWGNENNADSITTQLKQVPFEYWGDLLASSNYGKFKDRLLRLRASLPEGQALGNKAGWWYGFSTDMLGMGVLGVAAEPLALMGLGARTTMAESAAMRALGGTKTLLPAQAAAEAAATISRGNLFMRYAALSSAEETVYQIGKYSFDPTYDPSVGELAFSYTLAGAFGGTLGGAIMGRSFVKRNIQEALGEIRMARPQQLSNGYQIDWLNPYMYDAPAAADQMLFHAGTGSFGDEADRIASSLWRDYQAAGPRSGAVDFFVPGTRTMELPQIRPIPARRRNAAGQFAEGLDAPRTRNVRGQFVGDVRDALGRIPAKGGEPGPLMGMRSAIKVAAHELALAGMELNEGVFSKIAQALVNTDRAKLRAGGFNKAFWNEVLKDVPAEVAAKIRAPGERAFIGGLDKSVQDLALREDMVDAVYQAFRHGEHRQAGREPSLIFQVLQQIKDRGGRLNRQEVANIVDELRKVAQEPPTRINARGATRIDYNARRTMIAQIINSRVPAGGKPIALPNSLLAKMNAPAGGGAIGGRAAGMAGGGPAGLVPTPGTTIPKAVAWVPGLSRILNQSVVTLKSENEGYRLIGWLGFNARRDFGGTAQKYTIMEQSMAFLHERSARLVAGFRQNYTSHIFNNQTDVNVVHALRSQFKSAAERTDFNRRVVAQIRSGALNDPSAGVNNFAKEVQQVLREFHELASSVGLKGFDKSQIVNYFPRSWRWDRIRQIASTKDGMNDLVAVVRKAIDQNGRKVVINGIEETITGDIDEAALAFSERLVSIAKNTENAPLTAQDQDLFDALSSLMGPIKANTRSKTPYGRARVLMDESASISARADHLKLGRQDLSIADLMHDDVAYVMKKYMTSVLGAVNEKRMLDAGNEWLKAKGVFSPTYVKNGVAKQHYIEATNMDELLAIFRKEFGEVDAMHESSAREILSALRYEPLSDGLGGMGDRLAGYTLPLMYLSTGGQFGLAALTETSRIVGTLGLKRTVQQIPIITEMVQNWANLDRPAQNFASFLDQWFSPSTDRLRRAFSGEAAGVGDAYSRNIVKRGLDSTSNFFSDLSMLSSVTSMTQQLTAATTLQHLFDVAKSGVRRLDASTLRTLGLSVEEYEKLVQFVGKNGQTKAGFLGERLVGLKNMDDPVVENLKSMVDRMVRTRIQDVPTRGDFHKGAFAWYARFFTQFKTFNMKGIDNFLLQNASRGQQGGGARVAAEVGSALTLAALVQYGRSYADYRTAVAAKDFKAADRAEKRLGVDGFVRGALTGPSEFWLPSMLIETGNAPFNKDMIFSDYRYSGLPSITSPAVMGAGRLWSVGRDVLGATVGKSLDLETKRDITTRTLHNARQFLPFQNLIFLKQYLDVKEEEIAQENDLYDTQIRYQD